MHDHQTGIFHKCPIYLYVIYQQTPITVQYKIILKCLFKDILYLTLRSLVFKIELLTGVLCTSLVLSLK